MQDKIVVSPKGMEFRKELEIETTLDRGKLRIPKLVIHTSSPSTTKTSFVIKSHRRAPTEVQTARNHNGEDYMLYPNYLRRDPKEYPPVHVCNFKIPNHSHINKEKTLATKVKTIHHTIYNSDKRWVIKKNPSVDLINTTIFGCDKRVAVPINISNTKVDYIPTETEEFDEAELSKSQASIQKDLPANQGYKTLSDSISWTKARSSNFLSTARSFNPNFTSRNEKLLEIHMGKQKEYENTLIRIEERTLNKLTNFEAYRGDVYKFSDKLKEAEDTLLKLQTKKKSEDFRYTKRLKLYQDLKYSGFSHHYAQKPKLIHHEIPLVNDTLKTSVRAEKGEGSSTDHHLHQDSMKGFNDLSLLKTAVSELSEQSRKIKHI